MRLVLVFLCMKMASTQSELEQCENDVNKLTDKLGRRDAALKRIREDRNQLIAENNILLDQADEHKLTFDQLEVDKVKLNEDNTSLISQLTSIQQELDALRNMYETLKVNHDTAIAEAERLRKVIIQQGSEIAELQYDLAAYGPDEGEEEEERGDCTEKEPHIEGEDEGDYYEDEGDYYEEEEEED